MLYLCKSKSHTFVSSTGVANRTANPQTKKRPLLLELIVHHDRALIGYTITRNLMETIACYTRAIARLKRPFDTDGHQIEDSGHSRQHFHIRAHLTDTSTGIPTDHEVLESLQRHEHQQQQQVGHR